MRGSLPMIELLLRNGADPAQSTTEGDSAVELALRFNHSDVAEALKKRGAPPCWKPRKKPRPPPSAASCSRNVFPPMACERRHCILIQ